MESPVEKRPNKEKREKKPAAATVVEQMIKVYVNDRLGTKAEIPCLASDRISMSTSPSPPHLHLSLQLQTSPGIEEDD